MKPWRCAVASLVVLALPAWPCSLDHEAIRKVVHRHRRDIQACAVNAIQKGASLPQKLVLTWTIDFEGRTHDAHAQANQPGAEQITTCIENLIPTWKFPKHAPCPSVPHDDGRIQVTYPFIFCGAAGDPANEEADSGSFALPSSTCSAGRPDAGT
jgi:hypothetical protein